MGDNREEGRKASIGIFLRNYSYDALVTSLVSLRISGAVLRQTEKNDDVPIERRKKNPIEKR